MPSVDGVLTTKPAARFATSYLAFQAIFVIFTISSCLRVMTYHVYQQDIDVSKIITVTTLWEIVMWHNQNMNQNMQNDPYTDPIVPQLPRNASRDMFSYRRSAAPEVDTELKEILQSYVSRSTPALRMYSGMFDSRFVMEAEIQRFLQGTVSDAFPWKLEIESLDSCILFYSLLSACLGFLYYNVYSRTMCSEEKQDEPMQAMMNGDVLLFDSLYWFVQFLFNFILLDICSAVTIPVVAAWQALIYTTLLYIVCHPSEMPKHSQLLVIFIWAMHTFLQTSFSHAGISEGGISLICHLINLIVCYITLVEKMDLPKFLNLRIWSCLLCNVIFLFVYTFNIEYISVNE